MSRAPRVLKAVTPHGLASDDIAVIRWRVRHGPAGKARRTGALEAATGASQPTLSRDLARRRDEGLVQSRREAKSAYCRFADDRPARVIDAMGPAFAPVPPKSKKRNPK